MKYPIRSLLLAVVLTGLVGCGKAKAPPSGSAAQAEPGKAPVLLKASWPVGSRYVYRLDLDQQSTNRIPQLPQPLAQNVTMAMTYALSVVKETDRGGRELEMEFLANEMEVIVAGQTFISFDSKESASGKNPNPMTAPLMRMIGSKVRLVIDSKGFVESTVGCDEWRDQMLGDADAQANALLAQQFDEGFFRQLVEYGRGLPDHAVSVGDTWPFQLDMPRAGGKITVDTKVTLTGFEQREQRHCAVLDSRGTIKGNLGNQPGPVSKMTIDHGKTTGRTWFDPALGTIIEAEADQTMRIKGEMAGQAPAGGKSAPSFTSELSQKVTFKLVDPGPSPQ